MIFMAAKRPRPRGRNSVEGLACSRHAGCKNTLSLCQDAANRCPYSCDAGYKLKFLLQENDKKITSAKNSRVSDENERIQKKLITEPQPKNISNEASHLRSYVAVPSRPEKTLSLTGNEQDDAQRPTRARSYTPLNSANKREWIQEKFGLIVG